VDSNPRSRPGIFRKDRPGGQNRILTIDKGRFAGRRAWSAPATIPNTGLLEKRQRRALPPGSLSGLKRSVPGDGLLQVVDMRDTAIVGHRNYVIACQLIFDRARLLPLPAHDLACPPGHFVNRI
jgi:hypothetical protein